MKRCILFSLFCLVLALSFPPLLLRLQRMEITEAEEGPPSPGSSSVSEPAADAPAVSRDAGYILTVLLPDGTLAQTTMADYLPGVLAGEMPASFEEEALRAQAVAARSYILNRSARRRAAHPEADVCTDPGCCLAWCSPQEQQEKWGVDYEYYAAKNAAAVADTDGILLTWEEQPILACFHSSSAGMTESSAAVWSGALPYLICVSSPETGEDVPNYITTRRVSAQDFRTALLELCPALPLEGDPGDWLGSSTPDESGRVERLRIGGTDFPGSTLRALFALRSAAFTVEWTGEDFLFTVTGYGHGVGMSQYGANVMAKGGSTWREILLHYYPGAMLRAPFS